MYFWWLDLIPFFTHFTHLSSHSAEEKSMYVLYGRLFESSELAQFEGQLRANWFRNEMLLLHPHHHHVLRVYTLWVHKCVCGSWVEWDEKGELKWKESVSSPHFTRVIILSFITIPFFDIWPCTYTSPRKKYSLLSYNFIFIPSFFPCCALVKHHQKTLSLTWWTDIQNKRPLIQVVFSVFKSLVWNEDRRSRTQKMIKHYASSMYIFMAYYFPRP